MADRVRVPTKYPMSSDDLVQTLTTLVAKLPEGDRISCGFPGMVRGGHVLSAPHFVCEAGPGTKTDPKLVKAWSDFDLASALDQVDRQALPGGQRRRRPGPGRRRRARASRS